MKRVSILKATKTAIYCYMMGEDLAAAFKGVFMMRSVFNDMIDAGFTDEMINEVYNEAERQYYLSEAEQNC